MLGNGNDFLEDGSVSFRAFQYVPDDTWKREFCCGALDLRYISFSVHLREINVDFHDMNFGLFLFKVTLISSSEINQSSYHENQHWFLWDEQRSLCIAGPEHHNRTLVFKYHPGHIGKHGMRHFHLLRNHYHFPTIKLFGFIAQELLQPYWVSTLIKLVVKQLIWQSCYKLSLPPLGWIFM